MDTSDLIRSIASTAEPIERNYARAVFVAVPPTMESEALIDGRGDLLYPTILWAYREDRGWARMTGVVEASVARRWQRAWSRDGLVLAITAAQRLTRVVTLPRVTA